MLYEVITETSIKNLRIKTENQLQESLDISTYKTDKATYVQQEGLDKDKDKFYLANPNNQEIKTYRYLRFKTTDEIEVDKFQIYFRIDKDWMEENQIEKLFFLAKNSPTRELDWELKEETTKNYVYKVESSKVPERLVILGLVAISDDTQQDDPISTDNPVDAENPIDSDNPTDRNNFV